MATDRKLYFYDSIAEQFDRIANPYDLRRRLEVVFDELLAGEALGQRSLLDVGAGTGWFSRRAAERGARVTAVDIGAALLREVRRKVSATLVNADACALPFRDGAYDVVISSECVEHTLDPRQAVRELCRVTRPGGVLALTTPNQLWRFSATVAAVLGVRPYEGYEHWLWRSELRQLIASSGLRVLAMRGFHLAPPLARPAWPVLRAIDRWGGALGPLMLNTAVLARRPLQP